MSTRAHTLSLVAPLRPTRAGLLAACLLALLVPQALAERLPVRTYTIADGLAHDQVDEIKQDSRGFLWFCTIDGLSRFDGYRFTNYGARDGLPLARVNDLVESRRDGSYWVATNGGGVSRFDPAAEARLVSEARARQSSPAESTGARARIFTTYRLGGEPQSNIVQRLYEDAAGNVWAGTQGGLFRLAAGGAAFERVPLRIPSRAEISIEVQAFAEDDAGSLWIGTNRGVVRRLPGGRTLHHPVQTSQGTDYVWALLADGEGRVWLGHQSGLLVFKPGAAERQSASGGAADAGASGPAGAPAWRLAAGPNLSGGDLRLPTAPDEARWYTTADGLAHNNVQAIRRFSDGRVWIATRGGGVSVFDGRRFRNYSAAHGLSARVNSLAEDTDGNVWVGSQASGAMKIVRGGFVSYAEGEGLGNAEVVSIFAGPGGGPLVVAAKWTVNWFDGEKFSSARLNLPRRILESSSGRWQIIRDHAGEWWAATGEGLYRFPAVNRLEELAAARPSALYTTKDGLADDNISRLYEDSRGDIWIGSYNPPVTLTRFERATGRFHRYSESDGLPPFNWANVFGEDASGNLWLSLHNGGLARHRRGRFELFASPSGGALEGLGQGLYLDNARRLWVATSLGGVRVEDPGAEAPRLSPFEQAAELSSNNLRCFAEDLAGRFYVGTARGVDRIDPRTGRVKHFDTADGLVKSEVVAAFRDAAGALWFGTREGLSRLAPAPESGAPAPPTLIAGLRVGGVPQPVAELGEREVSGLVLAPGQGQVQIDFFGLSFSAGEALRYQYVFEGGGHEWSAPTDQRTVTASLAPGDYRFLVRAVTAEGATSERPAVVSFRVLPPVWRRWWFVALCVLAAAGVVYAVGRYRVARAVELERVRTRIATDLHDDIGASLSQIAILSEVVTQRVGQIGGTGPLVGGGNGDGARLSVTQPLAMIANTSREMVDSMSDIVWAINPQKDHLHDLKQRMRLFASDMLSARDIRFRFEAHGADLRLGADLRREVYLIFKECVNNLAKHSAATEADIELRSEGDRLTVRIRDNGRGFDPARATEGGQSRGGHGLGGMRRRAEALGGTFAVESEPGKGTDVRLSVPVRGARLRRPRRGAAT